MNSLRPAFTQRGFDSEDWQRQMARHPQEYIRRKLRTIQLYAQPLELPAICQQLGLCMASARLYVATYTQLGFEGLCRAEKRPRQGQLTSQQESQFKHTLLTSRPNNHHLEGNIWTGEVMKAYLKATFNITYRGGIYDLLERLNLSHQKAHADYGNADPDKQQLFLNELKDNLLVSDPAHTVLMFDEFSVSEKPTAYYGWAEKNTRPRVVTNEKKETD
jgi:transposase